MEQVTLNGRMIAVADSRRFEQSLFGRVNDLTVSPTWIRWAITTSGAGNPNGGGNTEWANVMWVRSRETGKNVEISVAYPGTLVTLRTKSHRAMPWIAAAVRWGGDKVAAVANPPTSN